MKELSKTQIKYLRKLSHTEKPLFQMGKQGLTDLFIEQIDQALEKRELIKFHLLQNSDESVDEVAETIAKNIDAIIVQTIGGTAILYRPSTREKHQKISQIVESIK